jgi:hypothetical protein
MNAHAKDFIRLISNPFKFRIFLLMNLPSAFFSGVRIREVDLQQCSVSVPYKWFSRNPFRSTYFACLSMAAEMSTGALAMAHLHKSAPPVSMLVTGIEGTFFKKATGLTVFLCEDGENIRRAIEEAVSTGEGVVFRARSLGKNTNGEAVAEFFITWSFKAKIRRA